MNCPDTERLLELALGETTGLEVRAHLQVCAECRAQLRLIREVRAAYAPDLVVPESLIFKTVDEVVAAARERPRVDSPVQPLVTSCLLGLATMIATVIGTGSFGGRGVGPILVAAALVGAGAVIHEHRQLRVEAAS